MIDDRELYDQKVRPLLGRSVRLQVLPDGVSIREASSKEQEAAAAASGKQPSSKAPQTSGSSRDKGASWTGECTEYTLPGVFIKNGILSLH